MMIKGFFLLLTALLLYIGTNAQNEAKTSNKSRLRNTAFSNRYGYPHTLFSFRAGMSWMDFDNMPRIDGKQGYDMTFGFMDPLRSLSGNFYWGMEFGFVSRGFEKERKGHKESVMAHCGIISPAQFGHLFRISEMLKIDLHLGIYVSGDMKGAYWHKEDKYSLSGRYRGDAQVNKYDEYGDLEKVRKPDLPDEWKWNYFDVGGNAGLGIVFCKFNVDFNYRCGILEALKDSGWHTRLATFRIGVVF